MKRIISIFILILFFDISFGQFFYHLQFGRSSAAIGTGEQNLTLLDPVNAMAGNPANLTFENGATFSFFRNPFYFFGLNHPMTNVVGSFNYQNKHFLGVEYSSHYLGKEREFDQYGNLQKEYENYEKAFSLGYAQKLNDKLSLGTKITYAFTRDYIQATHLMISAGISYNEKLLGRDLNLGMSLMHLGDKVKFRIGVYDEGFGENPSLFILGFNYNLFSLYPGNVNSLIEFRKGLISHTNGVPDNSFKALFKSWKDFNRFLETKIGIILNSKSVQISNRLNFNTNYFLGYSTNKYSGAYYNYGMQIAFSYLDYTLGLGFGGRWFSARNYLSPEIYGYETFDIKFNKRINWANTNSKYFENHSIDAKDLSISIGISNSIPLGIWKNYLSNLYNLRRDRFLSYDFDFEIKLNNYLAFINTFSYWKSKLILISNYFPEIAIDEASYSILTGLSFYPLNNFNNIYFSMKVGVLRLNPIPSNVYPKYSNLPIVVISSGYKLKIFDTQFQVIPYLNFVTFFRESSVSDKVFGFKKIDYGLRIGYSF
ncbi:MAG: hypothetical protein ACK4G1_01530 [Ignavibacteria bacterium]